MTENYQYHDRPEVFSPVAFDGVLLRRRFGRRVVLAIVLLIIGGIGLMLNPFRAFNAKADIDLALMEQGTIIHGTSGAVTETEEFVLGVTGAGGYPWDLHASFGVHSPTDDTVYGGGDLRLGEHVTVSGLGDFYLIEFQDTGGRQSIKLLYIPEST